MATRRKPKKRTGLAASAPRVESERRVLLADYVLGEAIGEGAFGKVRRGTRKSTGGVVAIKILERKRIVRRVAKERVRREIAILKRLSHPNIIQLFEVVSTPKYIFLVLEHVSGGELFDFIVRHGRVREPEACRLFHDLINGVDHIHKQRVAHRDLKPENLLLDAENRIKIADFGLGNVNDGSQFQFKTACGSPCYAAPEMIAGLRYDGWSVDVWACGVILFAMLAGYLPFEDNGNIGQLYEKILNASYEIPSHISPDARDLIRRILVVDPKERYAVPDIRRHRWYRLESSPHDPPEAEVKREWKGAMRRKKMSIAERTLEDLRNYYIRNVPLSTPRIRSARSIKSARPYRSSGRSPKQGNQSARRRTNAPLASTARRPPASARRATPKPTTSAPAAAKKRRERKGAAARARVAWAPSRSTAPRPIRRSDGAAKRPGNKLPSYMQPTASSGQRITGGRR